MKYLPQTMRAIELTEIHANLKDAINSLKVVKKPVPEPKPGEVLVKIEAAPCNPSDLLFLLGKYGVNKPLPAVPGWEGAGTVVAVGAGLFNKSLMGKRVACAGQKTSDGTWAEYYIAKGSRCIPLHDSVTSEQGATLIINPLTAVGLLQEIQKHKASAFVQNAAASQVGKMLIHLAKKASIASINIVRREEQKKELEQLGCELILNSSEENFEEKLTLATSKYNATVALDAVGGSETGLLLRSLPQKSEVIVYGSLSGLPCYGLSPLDFIFQGKRVKGFWLTEWSANAGIIGTYLATRKVQGLMSSGEFQTKIRETLDFNGFIKALEDYNSNMTAGKILLIP